MNVIHEKLWGIQVSSNNIVANVFASYYHLKVKIGRHTFQTLLHWKRDFPQLVHSSVQSSLIYCNRLHGYTLQICGITVFLKCVSFRTQLNSHY